MASDTAKLMQYMISHGCVTSAEIFAFVSTLRRTDSSQLTEENLARSIEKVNGKIKKFNMMIRSAYDTKTRQRYYALISTVDNDITRKASHHSEKEFEYFRLIWQELQDGSCELKDLHRIGKELKLTNYKDLIEEWSKKYWLHVDGEEVTLGPRANLELDVLTAALAGPANLSSAVPLTGTPSRATSSTGTRSQSVSMTETPSRNRINDDDDDDDGEE
jgi:hypothetical protein